MTDVASVIIVNWNGLHHLRGCLPALGSQTFSGLEIVVVDNGSTDGSVEWLVEHHPDVILVVNDDNHGFAEANNQGIRVARGDYIVALNNDTRPEPGWLEHLVDAAESDNLAGMVASQIRFADAPHILDSAGIEVDVLGMAWNRHLGDLASQEPLEVLEVFGPSAAAALYRRSMLDDIGAFDERYFAYYEDVDIAWRARRAGWRCLYAPGARVLHVHSATARRMPGFKAYRLGLNKWRTLFKHYPFARLAGWLPLLLIVDTAAWLRSWVVDGDAGALRGRLQAFRERRQFLRERANYDHPAQLVGWLSRPRLRRGRRHLGALTTLS